MKIVILVSCLEILKTMYKILHTYQQVEVYKCFRPGDLVLARVISIGDYSSYFLSTAENELGEKMGTE